MTDRELLELAAKSGAFEVVQHIGDSAFFGLLVRCVDRRRKFRWNPLQNDGDALRLAVKLRISLIHEQEYIGGPVMETIEAITAPISGDGARTCMTECINELGCDEMARVRRAITRAAAQIQLDKEKQ